MATDVASCAMRSFCASGGRSAPRIPTRRSTDRSCTAGSPELGVDRNAGRTMCPRGSEFVGDWCFAEEVGLGSAEPMWPSSDRWSPFSATPSRSSSKSETWALVCGRHVWRPPLPAGVHDAFVRLPCRADLPGTPSASPSTCAPDGRWGVCRGGHSKKVSKGPETRGEGPLKRIWPDLASESSASDKTWCHKRSRCGQGRIRDPVLAQVRALRG